MMTVNLKLSGYSSRPSFPYPARLPVCLSISCSLKPFALCFFLCLFPASRMSLPPNAPLEPVLHAPAIKLIPHIFHEEPPSF